MENWKNLLPELNAEKMRTFQPQNYPQNTPQKQYYDHFSKTLFESTLFLNIIRDIFNAAAFGRKERSILIWDALQDLETEFEDGMKLARQIQNELQRREFKTLLHFHFENFIRMDINWNT